MGSVSASGGTHFGRSPPSRTRLVGFPCRKADSLLTVAPKRNGSDRFPFPRKRTPRDTRLLLPHPPFVSGRDLCFLGKFGAGVRGANGEQWTVNSEQFRSLGCAKPHELSASCVRDTLNILLRHGRNTSWQTEVCRIMPPMATHHFRRTAGGWVPPLQDVVERKLRPHGGWMGYALAEIIHKNTEKRGFSACNVPFHMVCLPRN